nr:MAG TPA: hypothetical protein [Caudoviricetes sp.]
MARPAVCSLGTLITLRLTPTATLASAWQNKQWSEGCLLMQTVQYLNFWEYRPC